MILVTNPGSNVPPDLVEHYGIELTPQQIIVDGTAHDTRDGISFEEIDTWVRTAKEHPYVLGTSAGEFVTLFDKAAQRDHEIYAVMTSRKIIGSHDAALVAARTVVERHPDVRVGVGDTGVTDVAAGLATLLVAEARDAGLGLAAMDSLMAAARRDTRLIVAPRTLEYLVKGGRASTLRAFFADLLGLRPLIAFVDGELKAVGKVSAKGDPAAAIAGWLETAVGAKRPVWVGVCHGGAPSLAAIVVKELQARFDVHYVVSRPISPSIYLHGGPGVVGAVVLPVDRLPWTPKKTPPEPA